MNYVPFLWLDFVSLFYIIVLCYIGYIVFKYYFQQHLPATDKAVFITGCDSGFGFEAAQRLSTLGYHVYAGCLFENGRGTEILKSASTRINVVPIDITKEETVRKAAEIVTDKLGRKSLWAIVNNAGISQAGEIEWTSMKSILNVFDVNTFGMVRVTKAFLPLLKKSEGRIINITSVTSESRIPGTVAYTMSKSAARSFSNGIRLEMRKWNIKVLNIEPYFYKTDLVDDEKLAKSLTDSWNEAGTEITDGLGSKYLSDFINYTKMNLRIFCSPHRDDVTNCIIEAITSSCPQLCYYPGNLFNKIFIGLPEYLPENLKDFVHSIVIPRIHKY